MKYIVGGLLSLVLLSGACSKKSYYLSQKELKSNTINASNVEEDPKIVEIIKPYKEELDKKMNDVLIVSSQAFNKSNPEGVLGNLVSDIVKHQAELAYGSPVDFVVLNNGGLRAPIPKGDVTTRHIYELMPFENEIALVEIKGKYLDGVLNVISGKEGMPVSGLKMGIKNGKPYNVKIGGADLDPEKTYKVVSSGYLISGGDNFDFTKADKTVNLGILLRDAIIKDLKERNAKGEVLQGELEGRIYMYNK